MHANTERVSCMCEPCECRESKKYAGVKVQRAVDKVDSDSEDVYSFWFFSILVTSLKSENKLRTSTQWKRKVRRRRDWRLKSTCGGETRQEPPAAFEQQQPMNI